jgi:hypothetical protein
MWTWRCILEPCVSAAKSQIVEIFFEGDWPDRACGLSALHVDVEMHNSGGECLNVDLADRACGLSALHVDVEMHNSGGECLNADLADRACGLSALHVDVEMVGSPGFLPPEVLTPGIYDPMKGEA